jgi:hypothetical protein
MQEFELENSLEAPEPRKPLKASKSQPTPEQIEQMRLDGEVIKKFL